MALKTTKISLVIDGFVIAVMAKCHGHMMLTGEFQQEVYGFIPEIILLFWINTQFILVYIVGIVSYSPCAVNRYHPA